MKKKNLAILAICALLTMILITGVLANAVETRLSWYVIAGGGGTVQTGDNHLQHTVGQAITGSIHGSSFEMGSGYWPGIARVVPSPRGSDVYLPMISSPADRIASSRP